MTGKMEFIYEFDETFRVSVSIPPDSSLNDVLEAFEGFLRGSGYSFAGQLDFIDIDCVDGNLKAEEN